MLNLEKLLARFLPLAQPTPQHSVYAKNLVRGSARYRISTEYPFTLCRGLHLCWTHLLLIQQTSRQELLVLHGGLSVEVRVFNRFLMSQNAQASAPASWHLITCGSASPLWCDKLSHQLHCAIRFLSLSGMTCTLDYHCYTPQLSKPQSWLICCRLLLFVSDAIPCQGICSTPAPTKHFYCVINLEVPKIMAILQTTGSSS